MSSFDAVAHEKLRTDNRLCIEFFVEVLRIDQRALTLRGEVVNSSVTGAGFRSRQQFTEFEERYQELYADLVSAREAVLHYEPAKFNRLDSAVSEVSRSEFIEETNRLGLQITETFDELERTWDAITTRQQAAANRIGLSISVLAVLVSAGALGVQLPV